MKITRELIDNGQKIIHVNYTKKEKNRKYDAANARFQKIAEANRQRAEHERAEAERKAKEEAESEAVEQAPAVEEKPAE